MGKYKQDAKTKKCYWCEKRKPTEHSYYISSPVEEESRGRPPREIWICTECNMEEEVV